MAVPLTTEVDPGLMTELLDGGGQALGEVEVAPGGLLLLRRRNLDRDVELQRRGQFMRIATGWQAEPVLGPHQRRKAAGWVTVMRP